MHHVLGMSVRGARGLSLLALPILGGALALLGCSGAGNADLFDDSSSPGNDTSSIDPATPSAPAKSPASNHQAPSAPSAPVTTPGAAPAPKEPTPPAAVCTHEVEPNNGSAKATPFTSCFAGRIDSRDDVDWGSFTAPKGAKVIALKHAETNGAVSYTYWMNGLPILFADDSAGELDVVPGATYAVQIRSAQAGSGTNTHPTYQLDISFK